MFRDNFKAHLIGANKEFRYRGTEPGRLETFSDAVFALAITLLLISTSAPTNFDQIKRFTWELIPFAMAITLIVLIWHGHFVFFYRYGMRHGRVIVYNTAFLILILFYMYPLKFFTRMFLIPLTGIFGADDFRKELMGLLKTSDWPELMIIYGLGAAAVFLIMTLMYREALLKKDELQLNAIEIFDTKTSITTNLLLAVPPLVSTVVAILMINSRWAPLFAGFSYWLYPAIMVPYGYRIDKQRKKVLAEMTAAEQQPVSTGS